MYVTMWKNEWICIINDMDQENEASQQINV
jgi:hypothetical protein